MQCERCGAGSEGFDLFSYCAVCSKNLCADCMARGCCGNVPALDGQAEDYQEEGDGERRDSEPPVSQ